MTALEPARLPPVPPLLPPEVWGAIARETLAAEGGGARAWVRLSLINRSWRAGLAGQSQTSAFCPQDPSPLTSFLGVPHAIY